MGGGKAVLERLPGICRYLDFRYGKQSRCLEPEFSRAVWLAIYSVCGCASTSKPPATSLV
jgi:hypothetical protein